MACSPPHSCLTKLQWDLLAAFFAREQRFFLTGGAALAGFYLRHRTTEDLDLFAPPGPSLDDALNALRDACSACGAEVETLRSFADFKRVIARRGVESCVVDLVIDRAPAVDDLKSTFGAVRVDTLREIVANKICAVVGRAEAKDLVDLMELQQAGVDLATAVADASHKDASADPATIAWVLDQIVIGPEAPVPSGTDPAALDAFRLELVEKMRRLAFEIASQGTARPSKT